MLRDDVGDALKSAMKARDPQTTSTLRMILAAIKDRDIAARGQGQAGGNAGGIGDAEVVKVLQTMVKQRQESIDLYRKGGRQDLVDKETQEIAVIQRFLPEQMTAAEMEKAVADAARELGATGLKDMGRTMTLLRERHGGRMDFAQAGAQLKKLLGAT
jgi:uncharacterized protein YqeY